MRSIPRTLKALAFISLISVVSLLLAACGGGEDDGTPAASGTAAATAAATGTAVATGTAAASPSAAEEAPGITDTEILLGAEAILSGTFAAVYATIPDTITAYFKYINETEGGVCGRQIVYQVEDNKDDPAVALEVARKLVEQDKVFAMVGSLGDGPHPASWEYLNEEGVPDILVSAGGARFGADPEGHPWTVQMIPNYAIEGMFYGQYISESLPGTKVAVLRDNSAVGIDGVAGLKEGLDPSKNEIVAEEVFAYTAISISSQVTNMKKTNAEVAVMFTTPGFTSQAIKLADRMDWHPQWIMGYTNSDDMMFSFVSPKLLEGALTFQALKLADWRDDPAIANHYDLMQKYDGPTPSNFTVYAQTMAETAVEVLKRSCDNLTREGLMDAVESLQDFHSDLMLDGVNVSFSDTNHTGLQSGRMLRVILLENGKGKFEYFGPLVEFEGLALAGDGGNE